MLELVLPFGGTILFCLFFLASKQLAFSSNAHHIRLKDMRADVQLLPDALFPSIYMISTQTAQLIHTCAQCY